MYFSNHFKCVHLYLLFNDYIGASIFLSKKFNAKTSQDWHLIVFFLESWMLSNFGFYLGYFEYYIVKFWFLLKFSGKMYLSFCFSRQTTQVGSVSFVSLCRLVPMLVLQPLLCCLVCLCMYYSGVSLRFKWWFTVASFSTLLLFLWACSKHVHLGGKPKIRAGSKNRFPFYSSLLSGISPIFSSSKGPFFSSSSGQNDMFLSVLVSSVVK